MFIINCESIQVVWNSEEKRVHQFYPLRTRFSNGFGDNSDAIRWFCANIWRVILNFWGASCCDCKQIARVLVFPESIRNKVSGACSKNIYIIRIGQVWISKTKTCILIKFDVFGVGMWGIWTDIRSEWSDIRPGSFLDTSRALNPPHLIKQSNKYRTKSSKNVELN